MLERGAGLLAATTDMLVEGVDFFPGDDPASLGRRAVSVNLSDLAAMGAEPEALLLAIGCDRRRGTDYALAITKGASERAAEFGARLVGGDLSDAPLTVLTVALWGRPAGAPLTRSGARPGDLVFLTGTPGQASAGLSLAARPAAAPLSPLPAALDRELLAAYRNPTPRVALGAALARRGLATAAIDVSDGVGVDAGRLARASGVRLLLERGALPVSDALRAFAEREQEDPVERLLSGGDDYELLFTAPEERAAAIETEASALGVRLSRVGRAEPGHGVSLRDGATERDVAGLGHDHFRRAS